MLQTGACLSGVRGCRRGDCGRWLPARNARQESSGLQWELESCAGQCGVPFRGIVPSSLGSGVGIRGAGMTPSSPVVEKRIFRSTMPEPRGGMINYTISFLMFQELMTLENMASVSPGQGW